MYRKTLLAALILLGLSYIARGSAHEAQNIVIIEVVTQYRFVYDDGVFRKVYSPFSILDENGQTVINSGEVYDRPTQIKIKPGHYKIVVKNSSGYSKAKEITIKHGNRFQVITINELPAHGGGA
ncbi:MAG: hypothetical protein ACOYVE_11805 [Melioribacter sp.]|uniref:hypothetical protein n=1 Tax=Melioribacter sp. TaxID=2052167 RepID=UPI003BEB3A99